MTADTRSRAMLLVLLLLALQLDGGAQNPSSSAVAAATSAAGEPRARTLGLLAATLKERVDDARRRSEQLELVFLIDASASVGEANFRGELNFVRKLLSDFTMEPTGTRVSIVTFAGRGQIVRHVDYVSRLTGYSEKCQLLNKQMDNVSYTGGGTYTHGALMEAFAILENSRENAEKVVFLITDGFSNGGDPRYAANLLKGLGVTIFTFGIQTGNVDELRDIASEPSYAYSYFLNSFLEFETLARKALHRDLRAGVYAPVGDPHDCELLCSANSSSHNKVNESSSGCCDPIASCTCGTASGHYACMCPAGYFGSGLAGSCLPCPNGTYGMRKSSRDLSVVCVACPDANQVTTKVPATSPRDCTCAPGFSNERTGSCEAITCPRLRAPENGYFVKEDVCTNVLNAACGIRCSIGFQLQGDSIRLCNANGRWSGEETKCAMKTCVALRAPTNGRIRCEHENENNRSIVSDKAAQPIDTRCLFKCESGFQLRGSKVRNCLPLSRWDGLKTTCKPTLCEPLKPVMNAEIYPKSCMGPKKLAFRSNCTITCKKGYKLEGARTRMCVGRHGTWSRRHSVSRCIDKTRPVLHCPPNMTVSTLPGKNYAYVSWAVPNATDNSGSKCNVWSKPHVTFPWKVHIGKHTIKYIAQDISGNRARCSFNVYVVDKEPPKVENCENNELFLNGSDSAGVKDSNWDEPVFYDNSGLAVKVNRTIHTTSERRHSVFYTAGDKFDNIAKCLVNLTIQDACDNVPKPLNGHAECINTKKKGKQCYLYCNEGYAFAFNTPHHKILKNQTVQIVTCHPINHTWNTAIIPDCSAIKVPDTISQEASIFLDGDSIDCDNTALLDNLTKHINDSYNFNVISICGNELECNVKHEINCKQFVARVTRSIDNVARYVNIEKRELQRHGKSRTDILRNLPRREQIEMRFTFIAKIVEENQNNTRLGIMKLREKIQSLTKSGQLDLLDSDTNKEIGKLALNLHVLFNDPLEICEPGSIMKKNDCIKCPAGTFHNSTRGHCQSCPIGEYQSQLGATACEKCPINFFTRRTHARSYAECIPACRPGYYSRRRHHPDLTVSLIPCVSCEIGFYQPQYGQSRCLPCPRNTITEGRATTAMTDCLPVNRAQIDLCRTNPCLNGATCMKEKDSFSCECRDHYVGSRCEIFVNPCISSPCSSAGQCILKNTSQNQWTYFCSCRPGYTGTYCETLINECSYSPCRNGGTCTSTDMDITCTCQDGFEGDFCEVAVNHCSPSPCEMNSTCRSVNGTWKCFCRPGYLGLRCNLLPCDWLPCHPNEICVNVLKENADKSDYRCECPAGFTGRGCYTRIDHCTDHPCQNNGTCINNLLGYTCNCRIPFTGSKCETELSSDYILHFSRSGINDFVMMSGPKKNLSEFTVCFWLQSIDPFNYGTVVSYATLSQDNALTLTDYNGFVLYVNGEKVITDARMNDGYWHFICVNWENKLGSWQFYIDGILADNGTFLAKDTEIQGGGTLVFGQEQDELAGGFSESESFLGKLFLLDIWDIKLEAGHINQLSKTCQKYYGSLIAWAQLQEHIRGNVAIMDSTFCQGCPLPVAPFKGYLNITQDGLEVLYFCETGYEIRKNYEHMKSLKRKCLKHGHWEGFQVPNCVRVNCLFPGYFLRGHVEGRSYMYGDKITYHCNEGYNLRGNLQRICKADGKWSGVTPFCIGVTCKNLLAPDHGDIEYIIAEHDRDDLSILQVGQQLEFKCDPGYFLHGDKLLTCLENGTWDHKRPSCISMGCPPPREVSHGRIVANVSSDSSEASDYSVGTPLGIAKMRLGADAEPLYFYGDVVAYSCKPGYKFEGNHNLLAEFKLQCTTSGAWTGLVPDCVPLRCSPPDTPENARVYLIEVDEENGTTVETLLDEVPNNYSFVDKVDENATQSKVNVTDANILSSHFVPGAKIKIVCNDGYETMTESVIQNCTENEIWSGEDVICEPLRCSVENHPVIGIFMNNTAKSAIETQEYLPDEEVENYEKENITDVSKKLIKSFDFFFEGDSYGEKVILQCRNNFKRTFPIDSSNRNNLEFVWQCGKKGIWTFLNSDFDENETIKMIFNDQRSICATRKCQLPKSLLNGHVKTGNDTKNLDGAVKKINETIIFKCNPGYILIGPEKSICLANGTWSTIPNCKPITCEKPTKVPYAELKTVNSESLALGSTIFYQCVSGYRIFGQLSSRCLVNGRWSKVNGRCARISCGKPQLAVDASIQGNSYLYQDRLIYICPNGKFRDFIVCNRDGKWSDSPKCI